MAVYVTFLLDLAGEGDSRIVARSLRIAPDRTLRPTTAFLWKVSCNPRGEVSVRAARGTHVIEVIATARWSDGLEDKRQDGATPTPFQWQLVEATLRTALAQATTEAVRANAAIPLAAEERGRLGDLERADDLTPAERARLQPSTASEAQGLEALAHAEALARGKAQAARSEQNKRRAGIAAGVTIALVISAAIAVPITCSVRQRGTPMVPRPSEVAPAIAPDATPDATVIDAAPELAIAEARDVTAALAIALPVMRTAGGGDHAWLLARYGRWQWSDVEGPVETTVALVEKDAEPEVGKRLCAEGEIDRIERRDVGTRKTFVGTLRTDAGDRIAFTAVGSTGDLVKRSRARFCGIVTGKIMTDAAVFGLFDLPETRAPQVEQ